MVEEDKEQKQRKSRGSKIGEDHVIMGDGKMQQKAIEQWSRRYTDRIY